jgi:hypothetical protein
VLQPCSSDSCVGIAVPSLPQVDDTPLGAPSALRRFFPEVEAPSHLRTGVRLASGLQIGRLSSSSALLLQAGG